MSNTRIAVTLNVSVLHRLDRVVHRGLFPNRNQAIEAAVVENLDRLKQRRLATECAKLNQIEEQTWAERGLPRRSHWHRG